MTTVNNRYLDDNIQRRIDSLRKVVIDNVVEYYENIDKLKIFEKEHKGGLGAKEKQERSDLQENSRIARNMYENALSVLSPLLPLEQLDLLQQQADIQCQQIGILQEQREILNGMEKASRKQGRWAIGISTISLIIALMAAIFSWQSIMVSNQALRSSQSWQAEQIPVLEQIRDRLPMTPGQPKEMKSTTTPNGENNE